MKAFMYLGLVIAVLTVFGTYRSSASDVETKEYRIVIEDDADLLTDREEEQLRVIMRKVAKYGNVAYLTTRDQQGPKKLEYADNYLKRTFGDEAAVVYAIYLYPDDSGYALIDYSCPTLDHPFVDIRMADDSDVETRALELARKKEYFKAAEITFRRIGQRASKKIIAVDVLTNPGFQLITVIPLVIIAFVSYLVWDMLVKGFLFKKHGWKFWYALIPFFSDWKYHQMTWGAGGYMFFNFIPVFHLAMPIITTVKLGQVFRKKAGFILGMIFLSMIFMSILAFGKKREEINETSEAAEEP